MQLNSLGKYSASFKEFNKLIENGTLGNQALSNSLKGLDSSQKIAIVSQSSLTKAQKLGVLSSAGLTGEEIKQAITTKELSLSQRKTTVTTSTLSGAFEGLGVRIKEVSASMWTFLTTNPFGWAILGATAIAGIIGIIDLFTESLDEAQDKAKESKQEYDDLVSELFTLQQEFKTTSDRIKELQQLSNNGTITLVEQNELDKLKETNEELEREIRLKEYAAQMKGKEASDYAVNAITKKSETYNTGIVDISTGEVSRNSYRYGIAKEDRIDAFQRRIDSATAKQEELNTLIEKQKKIEQSFGNKADKYSEDSEWKKIQNQVNAKKDEIQTVEKEMSDYYDALSSEDDALRDEYGNIIEGAEETVARLENVYKNFDLYSSGGKTAVDKVIEYFGDGSNETAISKIQEAFNAYSDGEISKSSLYSMQEYKTILDETGISAAGLEQYIKELNSTINDTDFPHETDISLLTISQTVDQLNTQLKPAMESVKSAWEDIFSGDNGEMKLDDVDLLSVADTIKSELDELADPDGLNLKVDYTAYEDFIKVLEDTTSTEEDVKSAFNGLTQSIINVGVTGIEEFETLKNSLEDLGIVNNDIIAFQSLIKNVDALKLSGLDLTNVTYEQIEAFTSEYVSAENLSQAIQMLTYQKLQNELADMDTTEEVVHMKDLATEAGITGKIIEYLTELEIIYQEIVNQNPTGRRKEYLEARANELHNLISSASVDFQPKVEFKPIIDDDSSGSVKKDIQNQIESYLNFMSLSLDNGKIDFKTYSDAVAAYLKDMFDNGKISAQDYHEYTKQMLESELEVKICLAS